MENYEDFGKRKQIRSGNVMVLNEKKKFEVDTIPCYYRQIESLILKPKHRTRH